MERSPGWRAVLYLRRMQVDYALEVFSVGWMHREKLTYRNITPEVDSEGPEAGIKGLGWMTVA